MIYFLCPYHRTGGPENMHFLSSMLNEIAGKVVSQMMYLPPHPPNPQLYPEIPNVHVTYIHQLDDIPTNLIVVPEIYCVRRMRQELRIRHVQYVLWWQSFVHACINYTLGNWSVDGVWHAFHSYYQYAMVRPHLSPNKTWFFLTDFVADTYTSFDATSILAKKEDLVCFNGHKDNITAVVCKTHDIPFLEIKNMSREEVMDTMRRCKVYVDMGPHPGKDHMPREAAMMGCVVITNKSGSAAYWEDVPITEKVTYEDELPLLIRKAFATFSEMYTHQQTYRNHILQENVRARATASDFLARVEEYQRGYDGIVFARYEMYRPLKNVIRTFAKNCGVEISSVNLEASNQTIDILNLMTMTTMTKHLVVWSKHHEETINVELLVFLSSRPDITIHHHASGVVITDPWRERLQQSFPGRYILTTCSEMIECISGHSTEKVLYVPDATTAQPNVVHSDGDDVNFWKAMDNIQQQIQYVVTRAHNELWTQRLRQDSSFLEVRLRQGAEKSNLLCFRRDDNVCIE